MKTPTQTLLLVSLLCACIAQPVLGAPTSCYISSGAAMPITMASMSQAMPAGSYVCVRYCFTCVAGDTSCTNAQIASSAVLASYSYVDSATATQMAAVPGIYINLYSCATTNCNTYVANCSASTGGVQAGQPPAATPSAGSHQALHIGAILLAALMVIALP